MEPHPPAAEPEPEPEPPLPRGPRRDGTGPELEPALWAPEAAPGPPPWSAPEQGDFPAPEGPAEPPARCEEEEEEEPRLRPVFDALDRDGDGFVRVEEFVQFATAYGAEQVRPAAPQGLAPTPGAPVRPAGPGQARASPRTSGPAVGVRGAACPPWGAGCDARRRLPAALGVTQWGAAMPGLGWSPGC